MVVVLEAGTDNLIWNFDVILFYEHGEHLVVIKFQFLRI